MGKRKIGELDTVADFVSARVFSAISTYGNTETQEEFFKVLYVSLKKSYLIGLKAFDFGPNDTHKVERGLSLHLAMERIFQNLQTNSCSYTQCYAVHLYLNADKEMCVVFTLEGEPSQIILLTKRMPRELIIQLSGAVTFNNLKFIEEALRDVVEAA